MSHEPSIRELRAIVEAYEDDIAKHHYNMALAHNEIDFTEELIYPPTVFDGEGNEHPYDLYYDTVKNKKVGDTVSASAGAPGIGTHVQRITKIDDTGVYGYTVSNTIRVPDGEFYESEKSDYKDCPDCNGGYTQDGKDCTRCEGNGKIYEDEKPYATMKDGPDKYLFRKDGKQKLVGSADNEPEDGEEELEETDMDKEIREMQIAAGIIVDEDCDVDVEKNKDGECSPLTHTPEKEIDEDSFGEDLLLAPADPKGPEVDEDDMVYGNDREGFSGDSKWTAVPDAPRHPKYYDRDDMAGGSFAGDPRFDRSVEEQSPEEFDHDPDAMIDIGDKEDYEVYDFDNEFENMLGGSRDLVGSHRAGDMYEMNEIRRLAGLKPLDEEKADKDYDGDGKVESSEDEHKGVVDKAIKKELDEDIFDDNADALASGELIAYEIGDERAYYLMADILGSHLDFGPEDEILVPAAHNDKVVAKLEQAGFSQGPGKDFWVAGSQYEAELQNGYNDRKFSNGQDYFPKGAQNQPSSDLGPSASSMADNPMSNKMRMIKKDDVYETMKLAYRRHRKNG